MAEREIGTVTHYFGHIGVAAVKITDGNLVVGDTIHIKGHTSDITTTIASMQLNHADVKEARKGDDVGVNVPDHVREHDKVFKVVA
jgi:putative protease